METEGKKVMLEAFGTAAVKCALYNASGQELSGGGMFYMKFLFSFTLILDLLRIIGRLSFLSPSNGMELQWEFSRQKGVYLYRNKKFGWRWNRCFLVIQCV